jgi:hypothetical protein
MPGNETLRKSLSHDAFDRLISNSPSEAAKVIAEMDAKDADHLREKLVEQWSYTDRKGAEAWITSLNKGEARDSAIYSLIGYIADEDPAGTMRWLERIDDPDKREGALENAGIQWLYRDEETGRQRLIEFGLSNEKIDQGMEQIEAIKNGYLSNSGEPVE